MMRKREFENLLKEYFKNNKITSDLYAKIKMKKKDADYSVQNLIYPELIKNSNENVRYNLILPSFNKAIVFGGVATALTVFDGISDSNIEKRIIIFGDEFYNRKLTYKHKNFKHNGEREGIFFLAENPQIEVRKKDIFILTNWESAYIFFNVIDWQKQVYNMPNVKAIYLIQDYEPGFSAWSSQFLLADSTYKSHANETIAVFNSKELYDYFKQNNYNFYKEFYFLPKLNRGLRNQLVGQPPQNKREKLILLYGRPSSLRNAYGLLIDVLDVFSKNYERANEWKIISLGEKHNNIFLKNNTIYSYGKVTLQEYGELMLKAYAGISLMASPHPSYPPLEMSSFGLKVITNRFANKDLSYFNNNIHSVTECQPTFIAHELMKICDDYYSDNYGNIIVNENYINDSAFDILIKKVKCELKSNLGGE
ncbi:MAG: hypothetical protein J6A03_08780 [Lachnospiraceae bacterium]|nr:hypothetical protein [Lachnospiraceae bacterium]